ncbi:erythrocyte membrane protein 1 [Plasmodium falciparum RAJ116]|uniref:Erythrocyte membrane protein 1 n=1 Tax=Plasmodium falciparum RAJ116 TaxID=580058 RepID=A0A0L0CS49_PLAFA|nr:erythrocyte membrane protein 1 [Plasmodium falciparum RAJ116]
MGASQSKPSKPSVDTNESHNSARGVLEEIGKKIKDKRQIESKHERQLKGTLSNAKFADRLYKESNRGDLRSAYSDACSLEYQFHTNTTTYSDHRRHPCHGRENNRFSESQEYGCSNVYIKGNENKSNCTACVPPRRRHICDQNLEFLDNDHTDDTDDLLGNVLVTAKYEGESIVKNHPDKNSNGNKSGICTSLARSFADIGDIVRGRDMFKSNEKVEIGLKKVFQKINKGLNTSGINDYNDENGNYVKLREAWWTANRDQVWKAITCKAPKDAHYFLKSSPDFKSFSNDYCGHTEGSVPTYLDYVPQFLRWFEEWSEEFCRVREHKLKKVKEDCRGKNDEKYCDGNGFDCTKTDISRNILFVDLECPRCEEECTSYNEWLKKKEGEFNKQKKKYEKEIENVQSNNDRIYEKQFYNNLKLKYPSVSKFVETLKEGAYCTNGIIESKIDFDKQYDTFSHSQYCKSCPIFNLKCANGKCNSLDDITCTYVKGFPNRITDKNNDAFVIDILLNDNKIKKLSHDLKDVFNECDLFKRIRKQNWNCKYKCNLHVCEQKNFEYGIDDERFVSIDVLIKRWLKYFLNDYNQIKEKLNRCINNEKKKEFLCIKGCYKNCDCVEKWITKKREEWQNIKDRYIKQYISKDEVFSSKLKSFLKQGLFPKYIENALNKNEMLDNMNESDGCNVPNKANGTPCKKKDVINILLNRLEKQINDCKKNHEENGKKHCVDIPKIINDYFDEEEDEEDVPVAVDEKKNVKQVCASKKPDKVCETVKTLLENNDGSNEISGCNPKTKGEYPQWQCGINSTFVNEDGVCMPPRRQKLCVHFLADKNEIQRIDNQDKLREAFIKSAAAETFFSWYYYKKINDKANELDGNLKKGQIPPEFLRSMFYTFGDLRDFLFGTDISKNHGKGSNLEKQINSLFQNNYGKTTNGKTRQEWWNENGPKIWEGMLCALTHEIDDDKKNQIKTAYSYNKLITNGTTPLEEFSSRPQFLRWFTEWGEDFCKKRKERVDKLVEDCKECNITNNASGGVTKTCERNSTGCKECTKACGDYKTWLETWKGHYEKQKKKYEDYKKSFENDVDANNSDHAYEYLKKQLANIPCTNGTINGKCVYKCMDKRSTSSTANMPASLDDEPKEVKGKCSCTPPPSACDIVQKLFENEKENKFEDACSQKYGIKSYVGWNCNSDTPSKTSDKDNGSVCIPPRRQKLYTQKIQDLDTTSSSQGELRTAFIQCAAVETFFQWHKFKMDKKKEEKEKNEIKGIYTLPGQDDTTTEKELQKDLQSGKIPEDFIRQMFYTFGDYRDLCIGNDIGNDLENVKTNISKVFPNSKPPNGQERKKFWDSNAEAIWKGMVCALSYNTKTRVRDEAVYAQLTTDTNKKNDYNKVTFNGGGPSSGRTLSEYATVPYFVRWLEEWGEEFCRQRTYKLEKIENECRGQYSNKYSSGDGENCEHIVHQDYDTLRNLQYPSCATSCRSYKKWINRKKDEFHKQKSKYENEIKDPKYKSDNVNEKKFFKTLAERYITVEAFLDNLKEGSYCKSNSEESKIKFNDHNKTFGPAKNCAPCPVFGVESDLEFCRDKGIFDGIRKDQWSCGYLCGLDICDLNSVNGKTNDQQNIQIRALLKRWVETFLEDYNKIKDKISHCTKNGNKSTCINGCQNKCECVGKWINIKRKEWKEITERYLKQYEHIDDSTSNILINFLEQGIFYSDIKKAKEGIENLNDLEESNGCTVNTISEIGEHKYNDDVECLLGKLEDIIESCKEKHDLNDRTQTPCDPFPSTQTSQIPHDDPDAPEDKQSPEFCADIPKIPNPSDGTLKVPPNKDKFSDKKNDKGKDKSTSKADDNTNFFIPSNCVKNAAYKSREKIIKKKNYLSVTSDSIKNEMNNCKSAETIIDRKNGSKTIDKNTKLEEIFNIHSECVNEAKDIFDREQTWSCGKNINSREKYLCLPPRRKFMCMKKIEDMQSTNIKDKKKLLEEVIKVAKEEGVRILENFKSENGTNFSEICDSMKYSFADLGDIIRGRDLWKKYPRYHRTEQRLQNIFKEIHNNMSEDEGKKTYSYDGPKYSKLRNDWWDANRESIWKTMTCIAPNDATMNKTGQTSEFSRLTFTELKCGHKHHPPYDDYIPQRFRWMTEWSEYFCKALNKKLETFKTVCDECIQSEKKCHDNNKGKECEKCKEKCSKYKDFVNKWKDQYDLQAKAYEELYDKANKNTNIYVTNDDNFAVEFLKDVKSVCTKNDPSSAEKYLYKTSNCKQYKFKDESTHPIKIYSFKEYPEGYENHCTCEITQHPLDDCPDDTNKEVCSRFQVVKRCMKKDFNNDLDNWNSYGVEDFKGKNAGVLVPPRRRHICFTNMITKQYEKQKNGMENFKTDLLQVAYNEGYFLGKKKYDKEYRSALEAIKYTFADIADIVKGKDMINKDISTKLRKLLDNNIKSKTPRIWWKYNKAHVWHAMLCGYKNGGGTITNLDCTIPNEEFTDQFLRWFQEWTQTFCTARQILYDDVQTQCNNVSCDNDTGNIESKCTEACKNYSNFILVKKNVYQSLKKQYNDNYKSSKADNREPHQYLKEKCKDGKCACLDEKLNAEENWKTPYETLDDSELKNKCDCKKIVPPPPPKKPEVLPPSDEPFDPTILQTTIPFGIALALGSIAFLFMKKKPKSTVDLLRVLDIHKSDYGTPTPKSSNRYIPYRSGPYKGKTYIYMEGDTSGDEKYAFMSDTTDITSSESEYEEMDVNDIYVPGTPKYKTLIEVVLEPSKSNGNTPSKGDGNTLGDDMVPTTNTFTDEEWNELKDDFISQYIQSEPLNVPQYDVSTELPMNIGGNVLDDGINEKPFITSIHDRNLYTGEEYSYNVNMVNSMNDIPINRDNNVYSGIDLINDSLNSNNVDIYDELLKRKENELFGTNNTKNTSNNNVAKLTNSDPIMNQLDLLHKWLDRHRNICENWGKKEDILNKLKEEWEQDNNSGDIRSDNHVMNTNVSIEIDMDDPKGKKEFSNMDTILDDIEDDIYYDVNDENPFVDDIPMDHNKVDVPKKVHVEMKILNNTSNGSLEQEFPISDVWNI